MLLLAIVSLGVPLALSLRDRVQAEVRSQAQSQADVVAASATEFVTPTARPAALADLVASAARTSRGRVVVVDARGRLLADSSTTALLGQSYAARPEIARALRGAPEQRTRRSATLGREVLFTAAPILKGGRTTGAVRISQSISAVSRAVRRTVLGLAAIGGIVLLMGLAAGAVIAGQVARPLHRLEQAAARVAGGDLDARAPVEGSPEQRTLAATFNEMTGRLARALRSQQDFVADASHQLRTPLAGLRLRLEEARAAGISEGAAEELDAGAREIDRLAEMVQELLVLSRAGEPELPGETVDLDALAARAEDRWAPAAAELGHELALRRDGAGGAVWGARADIERALDALLENALRYAPTGTPVELAVAPGRLAVLDSGPGLEAGEEAIVFERFHRGRAGRMGPSGTGLGLPIARELARRWGGEATLENRDGGGARATLAFPVLTGASPREA